MNTCKECGFSPDRGDGFCGDTCKVFWKRRSTDPMYWTNLPRAEAEKPAMSEETKQKLREYADKKKAAKLAEQAAFEADNQAALAEEKF